MIEEWKNIDGYPNYLISNLGNVFSLNTGKNLKAGKNNGRLQVSLSKNGKYKTFKIHKLVALAFIPNPDNLPQVNHKDENPLNNCVDNLEWCSSEYNINYGTRNDRQSETNSKPVIQLNKNGEYVNKFDSIKNASQVTGYSSTYIISCCKGKKKKPQHLYTFKYAN